MDHPAWTRPKLAVVAKCLHVTLQPYFSLSVMDDEEDQVFSNNQAIYSIGFIFAKGYLVFEYGHFNYHGYLLFHI